MTKDKILIKNIRNMVLNGTEIGGVVETFQFYITLSGSNIGPTLPDNILAMSSHYQNYTRILLDGKSFGEGMSA